MYELTLEIIGGPEDATVCSSLHGLQCVTVFAEVSESGHALGLDGRRLGIWTSADRATAFLVQADGTIRRARGAGEA